MRLNGGRLTDFAKMERPAQLHVAFQVPSLSYHALSYHALSYHALSYHAPSYHAPSYHALSCHALSYHARSHHDLLSCTSRSRYGAFVPP